MGKRASTRSGKTARPGKHAVAAAKSPDAAPPTQAPGSGTRQAMRFLEARVRSGQSTIQEVERARAFAAKVLGLSGATRRDRLRACSLILAAAKHTDEAAKTLNSIERELLYPASPSVVQEEEAGEGGRVRFEVVLRRRVE